MPQASIPWDHVDEEYVTSPRTWDAGDLGLFMLVVVRLN